MAQLIQMRQRIKAIETIKKITHAMRLISMSTHARLKSKEQPLLTYMQALSDLFYTLKTQNPTWDNKLIYPNSKESRRLVIVVGSQKGLCGNFNNALFKLFEMQGTYDAVDHTYYIAIGKKTVHYLETYLENHPGTLVAHYPEFSSQALFTIANALTQEIVHKNYTQVFFISNKPKSFFQQKPELTQLIPFLQTAEHYAQPMDYIEEQDPKELLDILVLQCIEARIQAVLFQSLLAEQAARFLSMDSSTRNAQNLLETTELLYNKLRQAKITQELTELTSSF